MSAKCKCGDEIFGPNDQKWCCHNSCRGKGRKNSDGAWFGLARCFIDISNNTL